MELLETGYPLDSPDPKGCQGSTPTKCGSCIVPASAKPRDGRISASPLKTSCLARYAFELRVFPNRREHPTVLQDTSAVIALGGWCVILGLRRLIRCQQLPEYFAAFRRFWWSTTSPTASTASL